MRTISPGSTSRTYSAPIRSKAQVSEATSQASLQAAQDQRAEAARIANGVDFVAREHQQRVGAFDLIERVAQRARQIARRAARHQVHDHFGVAGGLENRAAMFEGAAQLAGVGEVAVVRQRELALVAIDDDGLRVDQRGVAGGGVARVADGGGAGQARQHLRLKISCTRPMPFCRCSVGAVGGDDAGRFLAAMLQRVEAEIGELGGFGMAEDAADTAVIVKVIVVDLDHDLLTMRSPNGCSMALAPNRAETTRSCL